MKKMPLSLFKLIVSLSIIIFAIQTAWSETKKNLVENPGFELSPVTGLKPINTAVIKTVESSVNSGNKALLVDKRMTSDDALEMDITGLIKPGYSYLISSFIQLGDIPWDHGFLGIVWQSEEGERSPIQEIARNDINQSSFSSVKGTFTVPLVPQDTKFFLVIKAANSTSAFFVDDLSIRPDMQLIVEGRAALPSFSVNIGIPTSDQQTIRSAVAIFNIEDEVVYSDDVELSQRYKLDLPDGYYTIHASAIDSDGTEFEKQLIFVIGKASILYDCALEKYHALLNQGKSFPYRGWLKYLALISEREYHKSGAASPDTLSNVSKLAGWIEKIGKNPSIIENLRGVQEWAYESVIDDSGQPFKLCIPPDYDKKKSYPLGVVMHGHAGNHLEYSRGAVAENDRFEVHVLGRSRGGLYLDHSEQDVINVIRYIKKYWNIDDSRVHLAGGSMGGGGTFGMAVRYPHLFASGRPICGYAPHLPITNALHVPFYSTHSKDDYIVPVLHSRGPLEKLASAGGKVILDECDGFGHASWNYTEGNERASEWYVNQVRPDFKSVKIIRYKALDASATQAYWLNLIEWGSKSRPADFRAVYGDGNFVYLTLDNVGILEIDAVNSPIQQDADLLVSVNRGVAHRMAAPLPDKVYVIINGKNSMVTDNPGKSPNYRRHTPGGAHLLYQNEALLVVWGTTGTDSENKAMLEAAQSARKGFNPGWPEDIGGQGADGIYHNQLTYSRLLGKPDSEVTRADLDRFNLILIGTPKQNSVVARIAHKLPAVLTGDQVKCSDGISWESDGIAMSLVHFNPLNPGKLIFLVASSDSSLYVPGCFLTQAQGFISTGFDLLVGSTNESGLMAARSFDSHWNWSEDYIDSPLLGDEFETVKGTNILIAKAIIRAAGSDFSFFACNSDIERLLIPGVARYKDLYNLNYFDQIALMELSGKELLHYLGKFAESNNGETNQKFFVYPEIRKAHIDSNKKYQIAMTPQLLWGITEIVAHVADSYEITELTFQNALKNYLETGN